MKRDVLKILPLLTLAATNTYAANESKPGNVLFIIVDDLRPEFGCYGKSQVHTPNIDALASEGVLFKESYCNIPVSGSSRASILTGLRPTSTKFVQYDDRIDICTPQAVTLNECFSKAGYTTIANGKVFHNEDEKAQAHWSRYVPVSQLGNDPSVEDYNNFTDYHSEFNLNQLAKYVDGTSKKRGNYSECIDLPDSMFLDYRVADLTIQDLQEVSQQGEPFFIACGFTRPHLPFVAPKKYWDLYDPTTLEAPASFILPEDHGIPYEAFRGVGGELYGKYLDGKHPKTVSQLQKYLHAYYACVSFIDAQVGRLLAELERLGLDDNTTVVLIGDHGWNLGEHNGMLCKHTVLHHATNTPLIVKSPGTLKGHTSTQVVEYVDIYPTLCDIAGVPAPAELEGESFKRLCSKKRAKSKGYSISRWRNGWIYNNGDYYYAEWYNPKGEVIDRMLFDHREKRDDIYNLASDPAYAQLIEELSGELKKNRGVRWRE